MSMRVRVKKEPEIVEEQSFVDGLPSPLLRIGKQMVAVAEGISSRQRLCIPAGCMFTMVGSTTAIGWEEKNVQVTIILKPFEKPTCVIHDVCTEYDYVMEHTGKGGISWNQKPLYHNKSIRLWDY